MDQQEAMLPFLADSLYCQEESWEEEEVNKAGDSSCTNNNIFLFEQDFLWEEEELNTMLSKEEENQIYNILKENQSLVAGRREAVKWILKAISYYSFSAKTAFLAVNYLDRLQLKFVSLSEKNQKPWMNQLAAVACLSLAAKVEETRVPLLIDLQVEECRYVFESKAIKRMELLVLSTLKWKMNPVTPFSFLDYITRRLGIKNHLCWEFLRRCECLLLSTLTDCRFMSYLPSVMASATMLHVFDRLEPYVREEEYHEQLLNILGIVKDKVEGCYNFVQKLVSNIDLHSHKRKLGTVPSSPKDVMDVSFSSDSSYDSWAFSSDSSIVKEDKERFSNLTLESSLVDFIP